MNFTIEALELDGIHLVRAKQFNDSRGYFMETWSRDAFRQLGIDSNFVQDNQSLSARRGTVRGLHYQSPPYAQAKLIRVLRGAVYDVVVDLRVGSPNFGQWCGTELSADSAAQLYVPRGFAHGFMTLEDDTVVAYRVDAPYAPSFDAGVHWLDSTIGIDWPIDARDATLSAKDMALPSLADIRSPFAWQRAKQVEAALP
jgi:dTDP-4-dehydrorhamnose 3,5-epimerase